MCIWCIRFSTSSTCDPRLLIKSRLPLDSSMLDDRHRLPFQLATSLLTVILFKLPFSSTYGVLVPAEFGGGSSVVSGFLPVETITSARYCPELKNLDRRLVFDQPRIMLDYIFLSSLVVLFLVELILNLLAHAMALRLAMCHTFVFLLFTIGQVCESLKRRKASRLKRDSSVSCPIINSFPFQRRSHVIVAKSKVDMDTLVTFLYTVAYICVFGFVVVNILHSLQLLVHRHDPDVHYGLVVLLVGGVDFLIKLFIWPVLDCGFRKTKLGALRKAIFYETPSILLLIIASLRCISKSNRMIELILTLDPALTIVACLIIFVAAFEPGKEYLYTLSLAAPRDLDVEEMTETLHREFPDAEIHDLHVYRESRKRAVASLHVRLPWHKLDRTKILNDFHAFFHRYGIDRVVLQPEFTDTDDQRSHADTNCALTCPD